MLWLAAGVLVAAGLLVTWSVMGKTPRRAAILASSESSADMKAQLERLEKRVFELESSERRQAVLHALALASGSTVAASTPAASAPAATSSAAPELKAETVPELEEERVAEAAEQRLNRRFAAFEQRFADEPFDSSKKAPEEEVVRRRVKELGGYELSRIDCRSTMCRIEVKADGASAGGMVGNLGLTEGGTVRRRQDGTFLVFAGRDGFPFHEVNRVH
jgi:hypothetical protein